MEAIKIRRNRKSYTLYTARFNDGTELTYSENDGFRNQLDVYNDICAKRLGRGHGGLAEITCRPMHA